MNKKVIIYFVANIPIIYFLFIGLGWIAYFTLRGNPTFLIPFPLLLAIFAILTAFITIGMLKLLKIYTKTALLLALSEIVIMYIFFWIFFR